MIRFSAGLVVIAIGVLIGGVATSKLLLVYIAIGLSVAALIALAIGVVLKREELFGEQRVVVAAPAAAGTGIQPNETVDPLAARVPAEASAATGEAGARGAVGFAQDHAAQSPFDQPAYGQGASGYGGDAARPSWAVRQDSPWTLEPPAASAPAASPAPTAPLPPWQERLSPPHGESFGAPAAASPPDVTPPRPESASAAPVRPSWFERSARQAGDTTADKAAPEEESATADKSAGTDAAAPAAAAQAAAAAPALASTDSAETDDTSSTTDLSDGTDASDDDDDWQPRRSWLLDDDAEETGDATAAEETASPTALGTDTDAAETAAQDEPEDTDSAPAEEPGSPEATGSSEPRASQETSSKQVTVVPGVPRYHEANCILIRFMADDDVQKMTVHEAAEAGCTPCRACQPDEATA